MVCKTLRNLFLFQISKWIFSIVPILQSLVTGFTIVFEETFAFTGYLLGTVGFLLLNVSFGIFFFCGGTIFGYHFEGGPCTGLGPVP